VNQNISELLPAYWSRIPDSQLLIILDGLDEIESKNKNDAIRQIELFSEQHPNSHVIVSCRTNFYKSETKESSGTLSGFSSYVLLDLDNAEIEKYIKMRLGEHAKGI
jgi:predicted NACHT family NTPase